MKHYFSSLFCLLLFSFFSLPAFSQTVVEWDKTLGGAEQDSLQAVAMSPDGSYLLGGSSASNSSVDKTEDSRGAEDYWVVKLNAAGEKLWDRTYGGSAPDYLHDIVALDDGGYLLAGTSWSSASGDRTDPLKGGDGYDFWVLRIDAAGNILWEESYGPEGYSTLRTAVASPDGGFLLGGHTGSGISGDKTEASRGAEDYWVLKIDENGNKEWDATFGGSGEEELRSILTAHDGGYLLGGISRSDASGDKTENSRGAEDFWVVKINESGNQEWDATFGGAAYDALSAMVPTPDGGYLLGGSSESDASGDKSEDNKNTRDGAYDYWVVKIDESGRQEWDRTAGSVGMDYLSDLQVLPDNGYLLVGNASAGISADKTEGSYGYTDIWLVWLSESGRVLRDKTHGGNGDDMPVEIVSPAPGEYVLGVSTWSDAYADKSEDSRGEYDYWVMKLQETAPPPPEESIVKWDKTFGGADTEQLNAIAIVPDDGFLVGGLSVSGASGDKTDPSFGGTGFYNSRDYWVVRADETGNKLWDKAYGGSTDDVLTSILRTSDGGFLLGGYSNSDPSSGNKTAPKRGSYDFWVIKTDASGNIEWQETYGGENTDELYAMAEAPGGGFLLGGRSLSEASGNKTAPLLGTSDMWVVRIDDSGTMLWDKSYSGDATSYLSSITPVPNGDYLFTGHSWVKTGEIVVGGEVHEQTTATIRAIRVDESGDLLWDQLYRHENNRFVNDALVTDDDGFLLVGQGREGSSHQDGLVMKLDGAGNVLWENLYGGNVIDFFADAEPSPNGYLVGGSSYSDVSGDKSEPSIGDSDFWLIEIDPEGNLLWDKTIGGRMWDGMSAMAPVREGEYLLAGFSNSSAFWHKSEDARGESGAGDARSDYWIVNVQLESTGPAPDPEPEPEPTNGLVAGGGLFHSPLGAITADPLHQGRASFSFTARQEEKDEQPNGHFLLLIQEAGFSFLSTAHEWMHVDGDRALVKGSGRLNRQEGYTFLLSVLEEEGGYLGPKDKVRIIIWDAEENIVYDNQRGAGTYAIAEQPIGMGAVTVESYETGTGEARLAAEESDTGISSAGIKAYPVPLANDGLWIELPATEKAAAWELSIIDIQGRKVAETSVAGNAYGLKKHWPLAHQKWKEGVYLLKIKNGEEEYQLKLLK